MELEHYRELADRTVGDVVSENYALGAVFKRYEIDFCCGGGRTVAEACRKAGVSIESLGEDLDRALSRENAPASDPRTWPIDFLADYITNVHHRYVREQLPALLEFSTKVARVHGTAEPELVEVAELVDALASEMTAHMVSEEAHVFPLAARTPSSEESESRDIDEETIDRMLEEHDRAGAIMKRIRALTDDFDPPDHACNTYRALFFSLANFEEDLHRHVHLENNVLFPGLRNGLRA